MTALTHGLLVLMDRIAFGLRPTANLAVEWLRDAAQPPPGLELSSSDGSLYSGLALIERNKLVLVLAVKSGVAPNRPAAFQPPYRGPAPSSPCQARRHDYDEVGDGWPADDPFMPHR
jgi:hypothetical protein